MTTTTAAVPRQTFEAFMRDRERIARSDVYGEAGPLDAITPRRDPATFFSPRDADATALKDAATARGLSTSSASRLEVLQQSASGDLGFWTGLQHAEVRLAESGRVVPMTIRVTEVFHFQDEGWKLVHRHADAPERKAGYWLGHDPSD